MEEKATIIDVFLYIALNVLNIFSVCVALSGVSLEDFFDKMIHGNMPEDFGLALFFAFLITVSIQGAAEKVLFNAENEYKSKCK